MLLWQLLLLLMWVADSLTSSLLWPRLRRREEEASVGLLLRFCWAAAASRS